MPQLVQKTSRLSDALVQSMNRNKKYTPKELMQIGAIVAQSIRHKGGQDAENVLEATIFARELQELED